MHSMCACKKKRRKNRGPENFDAPITKYKAIIVSSKTETRFIYLFPLIPKAFQPWSIAERHRKMSTIAILPNWMTEYSPFFPHSRSLSLSLAHTQTQTSKRTSAITPEITSLIDISITLRHSCVLSCLAHTPPIPNCSMDAPTRNEVTLMSLFFFFLV